MATRPWVTPDELRQYTEHKEIQSRSDEKLKTDIMRAEKKIISMTNNTFPDSEYSELPEEVKIAVMLVAEAYAKNVIESTKKQLKSETFDDYSYTVENSMIDINTLDLDGLLDDYIVNRSRGNIVMKMRKL